jgi:predicted nucleotidyltransferase component of viral defense system
MNISLKTAADFRKHLETNLRIHSSKTGEDIQRLRRKVAFDRLLARIFTQEPSFFFLKGGYAMELRISHARATKDMDLTCFKRVNDSKELMSELILQELQTLARINLNDYFIYQIGQSQSDIENAPYGGSQHNVSVFIDSTLFVEFHLDVGGDFLIDHIEKVPGTNWLEFCGIAAPIIPMISIEQQFAEKLHSYSFPREYNTRTKDLIDLILLLKLKNQAPETFQYALQRVFRARNTHPLPIVLPEPPVSWQKLFAVMAAECGISQSLKDGFTKVSEFYNVLQKMTTSNE